MSRDPSHFLRPPFVIAIDGPAASGKGTLSRLLAERLGLAHLDTGLTYRAVAHALLGRGEPLDDEARAAALAREIDLAAMDRGVLAAHEIGEAASKVAVMPAVREALVAAQRGFAALPPAGLPGAVLDGRDIGTVVCPDAGLKLYVTASPEERARRRWNEVKLRQIEEGGEAQGDGSGFERILEDIRRRDARDMDREDSPLRPAADAHLLNTTEMSIDDAFAEAMRLAGEVWVEAGETAR